METKLRTTDRSTRRNICDALANRAHQMVVQAKGDAVIGAARSLELLFRGIFNISSNHELWDCFLRRRMFPKCAVTLISLAEAAEENGVKDQTFWNSILSSAFYVAYPAIRYATNPTLTVPPLIDAGMLRVGLICLAHLDRSAATHGALRALEMMAPHPYFSEVYFAAANQGDIGFHKRQKREGWLEEAETMREGYRMISSDGYYSHIDRDAIVMCSNSKVRIGSLRVHLLTGIPQHFERRPILADYPLKVCSRCLCVTYCSKECQEDDWKAFHHRECLLAGVRAQGTDLH